MKSNKYLLSIAITFILLSSCKSSNTAIKGGSTNEPPNTTNNITYAGTTIKGNGPDDFVIIIKNNPIDAAYELMVESYDGSTIMLINYATIYRDWWRLEMEAAYDQLLELLDEEDCQSLVVSQASWEDYMKSKKELEESFFYNSKYDTLGTLRKGLSVHEEADEMKVRAYSLLEYLYIITGEINMVFTPTSADS